MHRLQRDCTENKPFISTKDIKQEYYDKHLRYKYQIGKIRSLNRLNKSIDSHESSSFLPPIKGNKDLDSNLRDSKLKEFKKSENILRFIFFLIN